MKAPPPNGPRQSPAFPLAFITNGMDAFIVRPGAIDGFALELGPNQGRIGPPTSRFNPVKGFNPELLLGAFELLEYCQESHDPLDKKLKQHGDLDMTPDYITEIQNFITKMNPEVLLPRMQNVRITMSNGEIHHFDMPPNSNSMLSEIYRLAREGTEPPFLMLGNSDWLKALRMDKIACIRFPWMMIAKSGAHLDIEQNMDPEIMPNHSDCKDETETLVMTRDLLPPFPTGKQKNSAETMPVRH